ncbi:MAG: endonuclease MutS2, partial [Nitrospinae bacterium]|nr:endonuclease MutS2 [Nitrospinota bacterium]
MTPHSEQPDRTHLLEKSRILLGWPLLQEALAGYACSPATSILCRSLVPFDDLASADNALHTTAEMVELLASGDPFPINPFDDIGPTLKEAGERHFLASEQCLGVLKFLRVARDVHRSLEKQNELPLLKTLSDRIDPLPSLYKELNRCIDDEGEIKENASPELKQAIHDVWATKQKLESKIGKLLTGATYKEAVQDSYHTEREGRLVIPVKADRRSQIDGIVHDSSGSGQTLYMEPSSIVPLNNQL